MTRDAQATRQRLLSAAADEFAAHGIAGARVDRIAAAAGSNKAQIYHYFGSKERLFDAVLDSIVRRAAAEVPIDVGDLPAYAGRLFDRYEDDPRVARLAIWYRLERADPPKRIDALSSAIEDELTQIRRAQAAGLLPSVRQPVDLLNLVLHMSFLWAFVFPELESQVAKTSRSHRRRVVTDAVRMMLGPSVAPGGGLALPVSGGETPASQA
ncbi:TetR family transcriptional regulator [Micromonospora sp. WMMD812]|uniref:TetR family transcriptional regulator n=1 Tax=Micromonospora sp. WMMD812 TaxID=3015152 RepID=UPI00248D20DB|nr:TetR family transcriptional regulator [Micromonospora sp. WMMD812]WBB69064.1 TetR family transcriptional regulator [Micromonospora sp. WMMD812]